jgi:hypothetical protein
MDKAYERLRLAQGQSMFRCATNVAAWNKGAAGIKRFYFRDRKDHVLEYLVPPVRRRSGKPPRLGHSTISFLGIDHTAIVVSDTDK